MLQQAQAHLAVVDQQRVLLLDRLEDFRMGDGNFIRLVAGFAQHQPDPLAFLQQARAARQGAQPDLGTLQIDQDADGPALDLAAARADRHACAASSSCGVWLILMRKTSTPASNSAPIISRGVGGRAQGGDDLGLALASHAGIFQRRSVGECLRPVRRLAGIDFEEAALVETARVQSPRPGARNFAPGAMQKWVLPSQVPPAPSVA